MTQDEASRAADNHAICESDGVRYYACGLQYFNDIGKPPIHSIILHDLKANSIKYCEIDRVKVVDWRGLRES